MNAVTMREAARAGVCHSQFGLATGLRTAGWLAVTLLAAFGVIAAAFFVIGNFTVPGTMLQLDNLASRYVAADASRQAQFDILLATSTSIVFVVIGVFRRASLLRIFSETETTDG